MSSDESEGELRTPDRRFFVRVVPWRNPMITKWLHDVDHLPWPETESLRTPERPSVKRLMGSHITSRSPPPRLPRALYSEAWLLQLSPVNIARLQVSTAMLQLPNIQNLTIGSTGYVWSESSLSYLITIQPEH